MTAGLIPTTINERWTLLLPPHRAARQEWPVWEKERLAAMHDCIENQYQHATLTHPGFKNGPWPVVFDIGAEEGDFPALWASWGADVVLVEPNPKVWPNIRAIFEGNRLCDRVRGWFVGFAGDDPRVGSWTHQQPQPGQSLSGAAAQPDERATDGWPICAHGEIIGDHGFLALPERPDVPVTTIDLLADKHGPPTVITMDVEGAELVVLRGATKTLLEHQPAIFLSVHLDMPWIDEKYPGDTGERIAEFLGSLGYEGRWLATDHEEHWEWRHPEGR